MLKDISDETPGDSDGTGERTELSEAELQQHLADRESTGMFLLQNVNLSCAKIPNMILKGADLGGAHLSNVGLEGANLRKTNLRNANLRQSNLNEADLRGADLQGARLWDVDFSNAHLLRTKLQGADLSNANLSKAKRLTLGQLAGANLLGAKLSSELGILAGLDQVMEVSKHARNIFLANIGVCAYSWLTIWSTNDASLLSNNSTVSLPILNVPVPIESFYLFAPFILLALYIYLHLYLQRLWEGFSRLPAVFPDGKPLIERAYPWLLTGFIRNKLLWARPELPLHAYAEILLSNFLAWWLIPITLVGFYMRYLPSHNITGISFLAIYFSITVVLGWKFHRLALLTFKRERPNNFSWKKLQSDDADLILLVFLMIIIFVSFFVFSLAALSGVPPERNDERIKYARSQGAKSDDTPLYRAEVDRPVGKADWIPRIFSLLGYRTYGDFTEKEVSSRPEDWWKIEDPEKELRGVNGANLHSKDLRNLRARGAFLAHADLRVANLEGAILSSADLRWSKLVRADLDRATLRGADLRRSNLFEASLEGADLEFSNLRDANLQGANLSRANLTQAVLESANLSSAVLEDANILHADLKKANLAGAILYRANLKIANLQGTILVKADLRDANLGGAYLQGADLDLADLQGANITRAKLDGATLRFTNLTGVKGLTQDQLDSACGSNETRLPIGLKIANCEN